MRAKIVLRGFLRGEGIDKSDIQCNGDTVEEAICDAICQRPEIKHHLFDENNQLNPLLSIYVNNRHIKALQGVQTKVKPGDEINIVPLVCGG